MNGLPGEFPDAAASAPHPQDLGAGPLGPALLHIERARQGIGSWQQVHAVLAARTREALVTSEHAALYLGAPAVAFVVHTASAGTGGYSGTLAVLDEQITELTRWRIRLAHERIDRGQRPRPSEYDLFYGLTGLGAYLLCRDRDSQPLRWVLSYLVRLTLPLSGDRDELPGWWASVGPSGRPSAEFPGGHGNVGMAHGIAGPLSLLSLARRCGTTVDGHTAAINRICAWLDAWRQHADTGAWWPNWITLADHRTGAVAQRAPSRPSWCYGTPGLVRAQQLAGLALGDRARQRRAERALLDCLNDPAQLACIRDASLCHGAAGLFHTTRRVAAEAEPGVFTAHLSRLRALLAAQPSAQKDGLLEGTTGPALVALSAENHSTAETEWDACLVAG